jgi:hypothetical protein
MNSQNIGDKLKNNVNTVLTGGGTMDEIIKYFDIDAADKRRKGVVKKADNHMMPEPEPSSNYTNNKNEKKLIEDIAVFLNNLEAKHQESNVRKRNKVLNGSRNVAVNQNKELNAILRGGSGSMYNKCRKLEDEFSGMI